MRFSLALIVMLLATPAFAKDITLTLNDQEQKVFLALLDAALKQGGLANLQVVTQFIQKYQQATAPIEAPKIEEPKK
jgi:hypothetical protein